MQLHVSERWARGFFALTILAIMSAWLLMPQRTAPARPVPNEIFWTPADAASGVQVIDLASRGVRALPSSALQAGPATCTRMSLRDASRRAEQEAKSFNASQFCGCLDRLARSRVPQAGARCYAVWAYKD